MPKYSDKLDNAFEDWINAASMSDDASARKAAKRVLAMMAEFGKLPAKPRDLISSFFSYVHALIRS